MNKKFIVIALAAFLLAGCEPASTDAELVNQTECADNMTCENNQN